MAERQRGRGRQGEGEEVGYVEYGGKNCEGMRIVWDLNKGEEGYKDQM